MFRTALDSPPASSTTRKTLASEILRAPRKRTIVHLTWSLVAGGSEMYAFTLASNLSKTEFRSAMCGVDQGGVLEKEIAALGVPCYVMNRRQGIDLRLMCRLYRLFRRERADVVHTHHFTQLFYGAIPARLAGARIVHTEHDISQFGRGRIRLVLRLLSMLCSHVVAVGYEVASVLRERVGINPRKIHVIGAGVGTASNSISRATARVELGIQPAARVVAIVARLFPEKNHRMLLDAFANVVKRVPQARLLIVGGGTEEQAIRQQIAALQLSDHVDVLGVRRDITRILAASDALVLCSNREGLPISVLEAMAAGLPIVATSVGDVPRVVREGDTGFLVPSQDADALADALARMLENPKQAVEMGSRGRDLVERQFSLRAMVQNYEALYRA